MACWSRYLPDDADLTGCISRPPAAPYPQFPAKPVPLWPEPAGEPSLAYNLVEAGAARGRSKSSILRAIRRGALSAVREDTTGGWRIEEAELFRAFPPVASSSNGVVRGTSRNRGATPSIRELQAHIDAKDTLIAAVCAHRRGLARPARCRGRGTPSADRATNRSEAGARYAVQRLGPVPGVAEAEVMADLFAARPAPAHTARPASGRAIR